MLTWLTYRILAYIAGGLAIGCVALSGALWAANVRIDSVKNQRDQAEDRVAQAKRTIAGFESAVKQCNLATKALEQKAAEKGAAADEALRRAREDAKRYADANKRRAAILVAPTPSGAGCSQAVAILRKDLK